MTSNVKRLINVITLWVDAGRKKTIIPLKPAEWKLTSKCFRARSVFLNIWCSEYLWFWFFAFIMRGIPEGKYCLNFLIYFFFRYYKYLWTRGKAAEKRAKTSSVIPLICKKLSRAFSCFIWPDFSSFALNLSCFIKNQCQVVYFPRLPSSFWVFFSKQRGDTAEEAVMFMEMSREKLCVEFFDCRSGYFDAYL